MADTNKRIRITIDLIDENDEIVDGSTTIAGAVELNDFSMYNLKRWVSESVISVKMNHLFKGK